MQTLDIILWIAIIVLILLPPSLDPAIRIKMRQVMRGEHPESPPPCFGDYPFLDPQEAAERDCAHCSMAFGCHEESPYHSPHHAR